MWLFYTNVLFAKTFLLEQMTSEYFASLKPTCIRKGLNMVFCVPSKDNIFGKFSFENCKMYALVHVGAHFIVNTSIEFSCH